MAWNDALEGAAKAALSQCLQSACLSSSGAARAHGPAAPPPPPPAVPNGAGTQASAQGRIARWLLHEPAWGASFAAGPTVFVETDGVDDPSCGNSTLPCASLRYGVEVGSPHTPPHPSPGNARRDRGTLMCVRLHVRRWP